MPVLALYGRADTEVSAARSGPEAARALSGNPDATVRILPRLTHSFHAWQVDPSGKSIEVATPVSDPETLDLISGWLVPRLVGRDRDARD